MTGPDLPVQEVSAPSRKLVGTLTIAGVLAGLLIVVVHQVTEPSILAHRARVLRAAVDDVLAQPYRISTLYLIDDVLTEELPAGMDSLTTERVFVGYDEAGTRVGLAISGAEPGFQDIIGLLFGYDPGKEAVLGMKVLESKETPGLGDKIEKDSSFVRAFRGVVVPIRGVKAGSGTGDEHEVDMITGATISSKTIINIINNRIDSFLPLLEAYEGQVAGATPTGGRSAPAEPDGGPEAGSVAVSSDTGSAVSGPLPGSGGGGP
jgi:electron transport complex protein RnfG